MPSPSAGGLRAATAADAPQLLVLWASLFDGPDTAADEPWWREAQRWFAAGVEQPGTVHLPVVEVDGRLVATAVGTLETGVPNPHCPRGRTARLANVVTLPAHRGRGHGTAMVRDVVRWARAIGADRVDLSATADGRRLYEREGFVPTSAPRMKLVL